METTTMVKLPADMMMEVGIDHVAWFMGLMNEEGEVPEYALKYVTIIVAE